MSRIILSITAVALTAFLTVGSASAENYSPLTNEKTKPTASTMTITPGTTARMPASSNVQATSQSFLNNINSARVALATQNGSTARTYINQAQANLESLKRIAPEKRSHLPFQSGRIAYNSDGSYRYYPLESGPITVKTMKKGPFWTQKGLAVTDAESVYLTLDLNDSDTPEHLSQAKSYISQGHFADADEELAELTNDIVSVDEKVALPLEQARDNLALARHFVLSQNYDGARYALKHADSALDDMEGDSAYTSRRETIVSMRQDIDSLQETISRRDPSMLEKVDNRLEKWWKNLKSWADNNV